MKRTILLLMAAFAGHLTMAQTQEGTVEYAKNTQAAAILEVPYEQSVVEGALKDYFAKQGTKGTSAKGLTLYKNVRADASTTSQIMDMYFKVERKSRKEKDATVIYLTAAHPGENIAVRTTNDRYGVEEGRNFLDNLLPILEAHSLTLQIANQENEIKKAEKKYKSSMDEGEDLVKKKRTIEDKIRENAKDQEDQRINLEKQRAVLDALNKRKTS